jgi:single-strand DNA-binding protein
MTTLNKVLLIGNLTRDPELRHTSTGTAVADLRVAVGRRYKTPSGEIRNEAAFLTVVVWAKQAEAAANHLSKGSQVLIEGRIQTRDWQDKDGQKHTTTEIVAE